MNKAKRIKTLEGYSKSLEERIEKLERLMERPKDVWLPDHFRKKREEASENQFLNDPDPKTARFFAHFLKHAADGIDCHDEERCSNCKILHRLIRRWFKSA